MSDYRGFKADLDRIAKKLRKDVVTTFRNIASEALYGVVSKTPVDTGALRSSWKVSLNSSLGSRAQRFIPKGQELTPEQASALALSAGRPVIKRAKLGDTIYISNYKPYVKTVEFGLYWQLFPVPTERVNAEGYSKKAPRGMVRVTIQELEYKLRRMLNSIDLK